VWVKNIPPPPCHLLPLLFHLNRVG